MKLIILDVGSSRVVYSILMKEYCNEYAQLSKNQDTKLTAICSSNPNSSQCTSGLRDALEYNGGVNGNIITARNVLKDRYYSTKNTLDILYNGPQANNLIAQRVDDRANFFGTNAYYYTVKGVPVKWFQAAEGVSRAPFIGLGADGYASYLTFGAGRILGNPDIYGWRDAAGNTLIKGGFSNFNNLYNGQYESATQWDINQLKTEQKLLQSVHEKYLNNESLYPGTIKKLPFVGINILDYKSRVNFGCKKMEYSASQGCKP